MVELNLPASSYILKRQGLFDLGESSRSFLVGIFFMNDYDSSASVESEELGTVNGDCAGDNCNCASTQGFDRRAFLASASFGAVAALHGLQPAKVMAGPFDESDIDPTHPIPLDKKLDKGWVQSLYQRGKPTTYQGWSELKYIGMPIGGIACGTVYLGGDGKLWCWDIFNEHHEGCIPNYIEGKSERSLFRSRIRERDGANYVHPTAEQWSPWSVDQGFLLTVGKGLTAQKRFLDRRGFDGISFTAQYPIGTVEYKDSECPVAVKLTAMTPFIPLDVEKSSFPAAIMQFELTNNDDQAVSASVAGYLENPSLRTNLHLQNTKRLLVKRKDGFLGCAVQQKPEYTKSDRKDILFADFEGDDWGDWTATGDAFQGGPFDKEDLVAMQKSGGFQGNRFVNTYNTRVETRGSHDNLLGTLTSPEFKVERRFINLLIAGGNQPRDVFVEVLIGDKSIARISGAGDNKLRPRSINLSGFEGQLARIRISDQGRQAWGQIVVDHIEFSDVPANESDSAEKLPDYGSVALVAVASQQNVRVGVWDAEKQAILPEGLADAEQLESTLEEKQVGATEVEVHLQPGESQTVSFVVAWHYPNTHFQNRRRWYATKFEDAGDVASAVIQDFEELTRLTRLWQSTWYRGSLPHWFLERTLLTADSLQTNTAYRFENGEFWAWEGIGCCPGTCTHVWHYAQAVGRLFPELERDLRERTDFGRGFRASDGLIDFRGGRAGRDATDGQAGVILRTYREHQVSRDGAFLKRVWPKCRKALEFLIAQDARDGTPDGIPVGEQHNTLDAEWFGKIPVLASLYLAALRAGEEMAKVVNDQDSAARYREIYQRGRTNILSLFNDRHQFFVQQEDPKHLDAIGIGIGCYIDQVMGQWWAYQLGMGELYDGDKIRATLNSLWNYNFCPDVGQLRESVGDPSKAGRPYALAGDAGLIMCTWPKGGKRDDWQKFWQYGYFNECMTGFEYEVAGHMIWESDNEPELLEKGLAITRAIHDRYHGSMRNPYNEIECSDHYARAMASYGVFLAACGFEYDGPRGHLGFSPKIYPDDFQAAFTAAEGWGSIAQQRTANHQTQTISVAWGKVHIETLAFELAKGQPAKKLTATVNGSSVDISHSISDRRAEVALKQGIDLQAGQSLILVVQS